MSQVALALPREVKLQWTELRMAIKVSLANANHAIKSVATPIFDEQVFDAQFSDALASLASQVQNAHALEEDLVFPLLESLGTAPAKRLLRGYRDQHTSIELRLNHAIERTRIMKRKGIDLASLRPLLSAYKDLKSEIIANMSADEALLA